MAINSRAKGASAERELAALIRDHIGVRMVRNLEQVRSGGHDLIVDPASYSPVAEVLDRFAFEVKRHATATPSEIAGWWQQTVGQAEALAKHPALAYRANRRCWRVVVPLRVINETLSTSTELESTADLSVPAFCAVVRELMPGPVGPLMGRGGKNSTGLSS